MGVRINKLTRKPRRERVVRASPLKVKKMPKYMGWEK